MNTPPRLALLLALAACSAHAATPALHGASGEDGALRGLLEFLGVPFVGSSSRSARLAWDKPTAKIIVERGGVATPRSITLGRDAFRELGADAIFAAIADELPVPLVVKPAQGGSAQGVSIVTDRDAMPRAMVEAYTYWDVALVEQQITGTEIAVGVIDTGDGPVALPAVEIEPLSGVYSFEARYNAGETRFYTPARLSDEVAARAAKTAVEAHVALGMHDEHAAVIAALDAGPDGASFGGRAFRYGGAAGKPEVRRLRYLLFKR